MAPFRTKSIWAVAAFALTMTMVTAAEKTEKEAKAAVSRDRAQQIALQRVQGGTIIESEFNDRWFTDNDYEFTVIDEQNRYLVRVDAETGEVLDVKRKAIFEDKLSDSEKQRIGTGGAAVTPQRARAIAEERAPNTKIVGMDRSFENDRPVYKIEMQGRDSEVNMKIDGVNGAVLSYEAERVINTQNVRGVETSAFSRDVRGDLRQTAGNAMNTAANELRSAEETMRDEARRLNAAAR